MSINFLTEEKTMATQPATTALEASKNLKLTMGEHAHWRRELSDKIKGADLTPEQFIVLSEIPEQGISANGLAKASYILGPSLSRMINAMRFKGFITTKSSKEDGRAVVIKLTAKGKKLLGRVQ